MRLRDIGQKLHPRQCQYANVVLYTRLKILRRFLFSSFIRWEADTHAGRPDKRPDTYRVSTRNSKMRRDHTGERSSTCARRCRDNNNNDVR